MIIRGILIAVAAAAAGAYAAKRYRDMDDDDSGPPPSPVLREGRPGRPPAREPAVTVAAFDQARLAQLAQELG